MNRTLTLVANGALLVLCCFLAARILASLAGEMVAPPAVPPAETATAETAAARTWDERQVILDRNLFHAATTEVAEQEVAPPEEDYEETELPVDLLGTVAAADPRLAWAAVLDRETRSHQVVRVGDLLKETAEVLRIDRRRIVLDNQGRREELTLAEEQKQVARRPQPRRRTAARNRRPQVQRTGENRFQLGRESVEAVTANPAALFSQARILPKYEDGQMVGVQLNAIKPDSLFAEIGIQDGDVINQINGIEVTGQRESAQVLRELMEAEEFNVTVTGADGQTRQLQLAR